MVDNRTLQDELDEVDRQIKELRWARHVIALGCTLSR